VPGLKTTSATTALEKTFSRDVGECVTALAWSPDGSALAAATAKGEVSVIGPDGRARHVLAAHEGGAFALSWSRTGTRLATSGADGKARIWDPASGAQVAVLDGGGAWVEHVAWSPKTDQLATAAGKHVKRWSAEGVLIETYSGHQSTVSGIEWLPQLGRIVASCCYGGVHLWEEGKTEPARSYAWKGSILTLRIKADQKLVAAGCQDSSIHCWAMKTGEDMEMTGYPMKVRELAWDPKGRFLASGGGPQPTIWDFSGKGPQGSKPRILEGHEGNLVEVAFRNRETILASAAEDGQVLIWNPLKPKRPLARAASGSPLVKACWRPQDDQIAIADSSGVVSVFGVGKL
jgi:WD40 repeat protein